MPKLVTNDYRTGDLLIGRTGDPKHVYDWGNCSQLLTAVGARIDVPVGYPFFTSFACSATWMNTDIWKDSPFLLLRRLPNMLRSERRPGLLLMEGPAVINLAILPTEDLAGNAFNMTKFLEGLAVMNVEVRDDPPVIETHTT
jgi:hypothetical protein